MGSWNATYQAVYRLSFSGVDTPGQYQVKLLSPARAASPGFIIGDGSQLYRELVDNSVRYFTSERDGPDVVSSVLDRQPANLTDEKAYVYADPRYDSNDNLLGTLKKTGGPVDVSGGWFDAGGGYEKFAYTASYADALMLLAARDYPDSYDMLQQEAAFGLQWITKLWDPGPQGALRAGRDRHRQRQQHDPGRLQLLVPAAAGGPDEREARREPRPERLLRQVPAGVPGRAARPEGQPQPGGPVRRRLRPRRPAVRGQ